MTTEAQKRAMRNYYARSKQNFKAVLLRFRKKEDADVLGKLDSVPNKTEYIANLIREDLKEGE